MRTYLFQAFLYWHFSFNLRSCRRRTDLIEATTCAICYMSGLPIGPIIIACRWPRFSQSIDADDLMVGHKFSLHRGANSKQFVNYFFYVSLFRAINLINELSSARLNFCFWRRRPTNCGWRARQKTYRQPPATGKLMRRQSKPVANYTIFFNGQLRSVNQS